MKCWILLDMDQEKKKQLELEYIGVFFISNQPVFVCADRAPGYYLTILAFLLKAE